MRYSLTDRDVIAMHVRTNSSNIKKACEDAGAQIGRSGKAVSSFYYRDLRRNLPRIYGTTQNGHVITNIKNTPRNGSIRAALNGLSAQLQ